MTAVSTIAFLFCQIGSLLVISLWMRREGPASSFQMGLLLGIPFAQASLLAAWNSLGWGSLYRRMLTSIVGVIVVWMLAFVVENGAMGSLVEVGMGLVEVGMRLACQWVLFQIPLWIARTVYGWRFSNHTTYPTQTSHADLQFGIRDLLAWTTIIAALFGLSRVLIANLNADWRTVVEFGLFCLWNCHLSWPVVASAFSRRHRWLYHSGALVFAIALTMLEPLIFRAAGYSEGTLDFWFWVNGTQCVWLTFTVLTLRWQGLRLVRVRTA